VPSTQVHPYKPLDVRFYSADGKKRRQVALRGVLPGASWRLSRYGGYAEASLTLVARTTKDLETVRQGDRVRVFQNGTVHYSGFISQLGRAMGTPPQLSVTCQGKWSQVATVPAGGRYISQFTADIVDAFAFFAADAKAAFTDLVVETAAPLGIQTSIEDAANKNVGDTFSAMQDRIAGLATYGVDEAADGPLPTSGITNRVIQDRLYAPRAGSSLTSPDYTLPVPGIWRGVAVVTAAEGGPDISRVANILTVTGADNQYPNLLAQACGGNVGFEKPNFAAAQNGNGFSNPSFELNFPSDLQGWNPAGGASKKSGGLTEGAPRSGTKMCELDQVDELIHQTVSRSGLNQGDVIAAGAYARRELAATSSATFTITLQFKNGAANVGAATVLTVVTDASGLWVPYTCYGTVPAGTITGYDVEYRLTAKSGAQGVVLDDAYTYLANLVQEGWASHAEGSATFNALNWAAHEAGIQGRYGVYVDVSASDTDGQDARLEPTGRFSVTPSTSLIAAATVKSPPGVTTNGKITLELRFYKGDGSEISGSGFLYTIAAGTGWATKTQVATTAHTVPSSAVSCDFRINFRGNSQVYVDAPLVRNAACPTITDRDTGQSVIEWIPDGPYQQTFYVTDSDVLPTLSAAARTSIADYGKRYQQIQSDAVYNRATAIALAVGYLNVYAPALARPQVTIKGAPVAFKPGQTVRLAGKAGPWLGVDSTVRGVAYPIAEITERVDNAGVIETTLSLEKEQASVERLVKELFGTQRQGTTGGGISSFTSFGGGSGGYSPIAPNTAGYLTIARNGTAIAQERILDFRGNAFSLADDSADGSTWVTADAYSGISVNGTAAPHRPSLNFIGGTFADNPGLSRTDYTPPGAASVSSFYQTTSWAGTAGVQRATLNVIGTPAAGAVALIDNPGAGTTELYIPQFGTEHLFQEVILTGAAASITFSGIPQGFQGMPGFRNLRVELIGRSDQASEFILVSMQFNGDTGSNYDSENDASSSATPTAAEAAATNTPLVGFITGTSGTNANQASGLEVKVFDYARTNWRKTWVGNHNAMGTDSSGGHIFSNRSAGRWRNTAIITQVRLFPASGNFVAGTVARLFLLR
jgi:hypothetical protein